MLLACSFLVVGGLTVIILVLSVSMRIMARRIGFGMSARA
jgi:hypothetical protein